jgi:hypothetical protein
VAGRRKKSKKKKMKKKKKKNKHFLHRHWHPRSELQAVEAGAGWLHTRLNSWEMLYVSSPTRTAESAAPARGAANSCVVAAGRVFVNQK